MNINKCLDDAKKRTGSDYATAKALKVTPACIYNMRRGQISNENARKLAELIGCSPLDVIAAAEVAKHPERADEWAKWAKTAAILLTVGGLNIAGIQDVRAGSIIDHFIHYAQRWARRMMTRTAAPWNFTISRPRPA